jgi:hypothetical protein
VRRHLKPVSKAHSLASDANPRGELGNYPKQGKRQMFKNLTYKSVSFGALVALTFGAITPAIAAGLADTQYVSLVPTTGTEYSVIAGAGNTFSLNSNEASSVAGPVLKWLVSDPSDVIETTFASAGRQAYIVDQTAGNTLTTLNSAGANTTIFSSTSIPLVAGDRISFAKPIGTADKLVQTADTVVEVISVDPGVSFTFKASGTPAADFTNVTLVGDDSAVKVVREARDTVAHTFVADSGLGLYASSSNLILVSDSNVTRSVTVQAWVDSNPNDEIDPTEYASPVRTIQFVKSSEVVPTTTLTQPVVGDELLTAKISTVPVLNGQQVEDRDTSAIVGAYFTRQDSTSTGLAASDSNSTWNDTTKLWTATVDLNVTAAQGATNDTNWPGIVGTGTTGVTIVESSSAIASNVATIVTDTAHGLRVGDKVTVSGVTTTATALNTTAKITAVPSSTSFRFAVTAADATAGGTTAVYSVVTYTGNKAATDRVIVGSYSAQAAVGATKIGAVATATVAAPSAAASTLSTTGSATVTAYSHTSGASSGYAEIKKGTTSVPISIAVVDASAAAVTAGRPVVIALDALNESDPKIGTFKINGLDAPQTLYTDASGKVSFTLTETAGEATAQTKVTATPEGIADAASSVSLYWNLADYTLFDLATTSGSRLEFRSVDKNGSVNFQFAYLDQWKAAPADGSYRLFVENAGNTVSSDYVSLSNGRATVTVTDKQIAAGTQIDTDITVQSKDDAPATTWSNVAADSWSTGNLGDLQINVLTAQTAQVKLDADGASLYGASAADLSDAVAAKATIAFDSRTTYLSRPAYSTAVTVSGQVANASTGLLRGSATVTISGDSSMLFNDGSVDAFGSLTFLADSSGKFDVDIYSTKALKDSVVTVTSGGQSATVKVTFTALAASTASIEAVKSISSGRTAVLTVSFLDKWGNPATGTNTATMTSSGPGSLIYTTSQTAVSGTLTNRLVTESGDFGAATFSAETNTLDAAGEKVILTGSTWVGPIANATASATKGRVLIETYSAKGKTVTVYVGSKLKATFVAKKTNNTYVLKGVKSGTRKIKVKLSGSGQDFSGSIGVM